MTTETVRLDALVSCREDVERIQRLIIHREDASRLGMTENELWRWKAVLQAAWEDGGGFEGARVRLKFAQDYLDKEMVANAGLTRLPASGQSGEPKANES